MVHVLWINDDVCENGGQYYYLITLYTLSGPRGKKKKKTHRETSKGEAAKLTGRLLHLPGPEYSNTNRLVAQSFENTNVAFLPLYRPR